MNLTVRILIGMVSGIVVGLLIQFSTSPEAWIQTFLVHGILDTGGTLFVASLRLMVVPLVFVSLVCGASNLADGAAMGRLGGKTLGLYLMTTAIAISLALSLALIVSPGESGSFATTTEYSPRETPSFKEVVIGIFPTNPVAAMAEGKMLQIIVFALLFGIAIAKVGTPGQKIKAAFEDLNAILMRLIMMLVQVAPIGVFCLMAKLFTTVGWAQIADLATYFITVVSALVIVVVYPIILTLLARVNPISFFGKMREPMVFAFSTSSSGATLPITLRTVRERLGVSNQIASFSVPLGATINMDGTAIMQGVATVFIAQVYAVDLVFADYLTVIITATMASIGTAAVPGVGIIMLTMVLAQVGLPVEGIALILGVDRLLDMMRTAVNVAGDSTVALTVAQTEGQIDRKILNT